MTWRSDWSNYVSSERKRRDSRNPVSRISWPRRVWTERITSGRLRLRPESASKNTSSTRKEFWAYATNEQLSNEELIAEDYRGIRPAPGYPACPDHSEKAKLWELLDVEASIGLRLTESYAMYPTAAVSGFYLSHPEARYFAVGKVDRDQVESYARRQGISIEQAEKNLAPNLGYDPAAAQVA